MLILDNVTISCNEKEILKNINLRIEQGELHLIVGGKGSGKSTLAHYLCGHPELIKESGKSRFKKRNLDKINPLERFRSGMFTSFQYPPEIEGVTIFDIIKLGNESLKKPLTDLEVRFDNICDFLDLRKSIRFVPMSLNYLAPSEIKKLELLQILYFLPEFSIIDEIDEDLSKTDLEIFVNSVDKIIEIEKSVLVITNNKYLLDTLKPKYLHMLEKGELKTFSNKELLQKEIGNGNQ